ncbi:hypothetical protein D3C80_1815090 [compost metagenome]
MGEARRQCAEAGAVVMQEAWLVGGGEAIYVDAGEGLIELIELPQANRDFFAMMKTQAREWDGRDPIRTLG